MGFVRRVISSTLDLANLAKHNANFADIETDLTEHRGRIGAVETEQAAQGERIDNIVASSGESNLEIVDAREDYGTLRERLNTEFGGVNAQLADIAINPASFGAVGDGVTDETAAFTAMSAFVNSMPYDDKKMIRIEFAQGKHYKYSGGLSFTRPVELSGLAIMDYIGTGKVVECGRSDNTLATYELCYAVKDLLFTGGEFMSHGLFFHNFVTMPVVKCRFVDFGNASAYGVWLDGNNWDTDMSGAQWKTFSTFNRASNFVKVNPRGINATRFRGDDILATHQSPYGGLGFWFDGYNNTLANSKIEGFTPNVRIGRFANNSVITNTYFEVDKGSTGCIQFGDDVSSDYVGDLTIRDVYCNVHNTDLGTANYFLQPTRTDVGLQNCLLDNVVVSNSNRELVKLNNVGSQTGNKVTNCSGYAVNVSTLFSDTWGGDQGSSPVFKNSSNQSLYLCIEAGLDSAQYAGVNISNFNGDSLYQFDTAAAINRANHFIQGKLVMSLRKDEGIESADGLFRIAKQTAATDTMAGHFFEDTDGKIKYRNLAGTVYDLTT
ncbi:hypothetical protein PAECIP111892_01758 [Paenibacillus auburnensis]|uniref:Uncharacterized protein n=1 Tax=Paenibacillus auburnensis TaxID=2905649 RepID=A0ABM9BU95_9BACL|nr:hypothetical protein [Paenibacillus auburnensis]CAH1194599.1 hypothetical protein PAECIP111892_01758 [Paenibacillus auburnensis]